MTAIKWGALFIHNHHLDFSEKYKISVIFLLQMA